MKPFAKRQMLLYLVALERGIALYRHHSRSAPCLHLFRASRTLDIQSTSIYIRVFFSGAGILAAHSLAPEASCSSLLNRYPKNVMNS